MVIPAGWRYAVSFTVAWCGVLLTIAACGAPGTPATRQEPTADPIIGAPDPEVGRALFVGDVAIDGFIACATCHTADPAAADSVGPNLAGVAIRGGARVPGLSTEAYLRHSIASHDEFVVPGFAGGLVRSMLGKEFGELLSPDAQAHLVAYLLTLDEPAVAASGAAQAVRSAPAAPPEPSGTMADPTPKPAMPSATAADSGAAAASPVPPIAGGSRLEASPALATPTPAPASPTAPPASPTPAALSPTPAPASPTAPPASPTSAPPSATLQPAPTTPPAPSPVPTAASDPPPAPTAAPTAPPAVPDDPDLARYAGCVSCHAQHPAQVRMPHPLNPTCNECHRGSPSRIGCPSCHSLHQVDNKHEPLPDLQCATCHT